MAATEVERLGRAAAVQQRKRQAVLWVRKKGAGVETLRAPCPVIMLPLRRNMVRTSSGCPYR